MNPKVSIIVPVYNVEKYLDRCMESLLNQTLKDIEIILVDDGSPDNCPKMCDDYAKKDSRVKVVHKANAGLGYARNSGLDVATGEFLAFVDSDDYVDTKIYESLFGEASISGADAVFCKYYTEQADGTWKECNEVNRRTEWNNKEINDFLLNIIATEPYVKKERKYGMSVWHSIYRRKIIYDNNIRFYSERDVMSEDLPFQVDFFLKANKMVYLPYAFYYYCLNGGSLTTTFKPEKYERMKSLYQLLNAKLEVVEGYRLRTDKFLIGYVRIFLIDLFRYNYYNKIYLIKMICNDIIWKDIMILYKPSYLSIYPRVIYTLMIKKEVKALASFCWFVNYIKQIKGKR